MPTITIQVGQAGNQLGQSLWEQLGAQPCHPNCVSGEDSAFFKYELGASSTTARRRARCVLVDTEPKVVNSLLSRDQEGIFTRQHCFVGQSGRGNNWAYGYHQMSAKGKQRPSNAQERWNSSAATQDPSDQEFHILEHVFEGIRRESEACDGAPDFLLLHSLGGGSGSGMGSRILERVRHDFPRNFIATASIAPRSAGDSPMQSLNTVMALSFLQCYADAVMLFNNQEWIDKASRAAAVDLTDINRLMAAAIAGALWPLGRDEAIGGGQTRIRDMVTSVAPDSCMKLLSARTAVCTPNTPATSMWGEAVRAVLRQLPKFDDLDGNRPVTTTGSLLLARGFPSGLSTDVAVAAYAKACGPTSFAPPVDATANTALRTGASGMVPSGACESSPGLSSISRTAGRVKVAGCPSLSLVTNCSTPVGILSSTVDRALAICDAGAYLHWYEKYGCSKEAVVHAAHSLLDTADCYRMAHGMQRDE